jgi:hypothetical protein
VVSAAGNTTFCQGGNVLLETASINGAAYQWKLNGTNINGATAATYVASQSGAYTVSVVTNCGTATSTGLNVSVNALPATPVISQVAADSLLASTAGNIYEWKRNGTVLPVSSRKIKVTASGNYTVKVTDTNSCASALSPAFTYVVTGVEEEMAAKLRLYPNPVQDYLYLPINTVFNQLTITDLSGKTLLQQTKPGQRIDLTTFSSGTYIVSLQQEDKIRYVKIVKE